MIRVRWIDGDGKTRVVCYDYATEALTQIEELVVHYHDPRIEKIEIEFEDND